MSTNANKRQLPVDNLIETDIFDFFKRQLQQLATTFLFLIFNMACFSQTWQPIDSGAHGHVNTLVVYKGELYAGGKFDLFFSNSQQRISNVAKWNGQKWNKIGNDTIHGEIYALTEYKGELYAGGDFTVNGNKCMINIAKWNGISWDTVENSFDGNIKFLTEYNGDLYACHKKGNESNVLRKKGKQWINVSGKINGQISALTVFKGNLYSIGNFSDSTINGNSNRFSRNKSYVLDKSKISTPLYFAKYDGKNWLRLDTTSYFSKTQLDNVVSVCVLNNFLYIASCWIYPDDMSYGTIDNFVKWDGIIDAVKADTIDYNKTWGYISGAMGVFENKLYAYGNFWAPGRNVSGVFFAKWDGKNWSVLKGENGWFWGKANAFSIYNGELYLGGFENGHGKETGGMEPSHCVAKLVVLKQVK